MKTDWLTEVTGYVTEATELSILKLCEAGRSHTKVGKVAAEPEKLSLEQRKSGRH